ncbi:Serine/threonine-protein kinase plk-2 [Fusarium oxysporum f. sp. albedinis]|nr:Serine/threonine-protein kinase plk-2 [Fusarium oxysporum f. sp. albedinis]
MELIVLHKGAPDAICMSTWHSNYHFQVFISSKLNKLKALPSFMMELWGTKDHQLNQKLMSSQGQNSRTVLSIHTS